MLEWSYGKPLPFTGTGLEKLMRNRSGLPPPTTLRVVQSELLLGHLDAPISQRQLCLSGLEAAPRNSVSGVTVMLDVHLDISQQPAPVAK